MIKALKSLFEMPQKQTAEDRVRRMHVAAAALLIETARADFTESTGEREKLTALLTQTLPLSTDEVSQLITLATEQVDNATSLYEFTREINDNYNPQDKLALIGAMWQVAYADGQVDKYEEALIRQVAELTYVPHVDYIRVKLEAKAGKP